MIALCHINDIADDHAKSFEIDGVPLFVVRKNSQLFVYHNSCPHLGIQLEWQPDRFLDSDSELIQCSTHGALFVIESGHCVSGPCSGQALLAITFQQQDEQIFIDPKQLPPRK